MKKAYLLSVLLIGVCLLAVTVLAARFRRTPHATHSPQRAASQQIEEKTVIHVVNSGKPSVNLRDGRELITEYSGPSDLIQQLNAKQAEPRSLAAGDFDGNGISDLVVGYAASSGGIIALHRGNVDALYPSSREAQRRKEAGQFTDAVFLPEVRVFAIDQPVDFIGAADLDDDGYLDVLTGARGGSAIFFLKGDGHGNVVAPRRIELPGRLTTMLVRSDNDISRSANVVLGLATTSGPEAFWVDEPNAILKMNSTGIFPLALGEGLNDGVSNVLLDLHGGQSVNQWNEISPQMSSGAISLPAEASASAIGYLDDDSLPDLAIAAGSEIVLVHRTHSTADNQISIERRTLPFPIASLVLGRFDNDAGESIALLSDEGAVYRLALQNHRASHSARSANAARSQMADGGLEAFTLESTEGPPLQASQLIVTKTSLSKGDDLLELDRDNNRCHFLTGSRAKEKKSARKQAQSISLSYRLTASLDVDSQPIAALPMRLNPDAMDDLVMLQKGESAPSVLLTTPTSTYVVTTTDINSNSGLPAILAFASGNPGSTITFNIPASDPNCNATTHICTIRPGGFFPYITATGTTVDGKTQPGYSIQDHIPLIEINASSLPSRAGAIGVLAGQCIVRGLMVDRMPGSASSGMKIANLSGVTIEDNFVGTDGNIALPNGSNGIDVENATGVLIRNNLVSGNTGNNIGISATSGPAGNDVLSNFIGTDKTGTRAVGGAYGVAVIGSNANNIEFNTIAFNHGGVLIQSGTSNFISQNSISDNNPGISLVSGGNNLQAAPILSSAVNDGSNVRIEGSLQGVAGAQYQIEFFLNDTCGGQPPNDFGEGKVYLGSKVITADASGTVAFTGANAATFSRNGKTGNIITATTTLYSTLDTSAFSNCVTATGASSCTYSISPSDKQFDGNGGNGVVTVTKSESTCAWTVTNHNPEFISITSGGSGNGTGSVNYSVIQNFGGNRVGTLTIADKTFTVAQDGCNFQISPRSFIEAVSSQSGGDIDNQQVNVWASAGCSWSAVSNDLSFITITSASNGVGNGLVTFKVAKNTGQPRSGTLTVAGQTVTVGQRGSTVITAPPKFCSQDPPKPITDNPSFGHEGPHTISTLKVPDHLLVRDVTVILDITPSIAMTSRDLLFNLASPDGHRLTALEDPDADIYAGFDQLYFPFMDGGGQETNYNYGGRDAKGTWRLDIIDTVPGNAATLNGWCIQVTGINEGCAVVADPRGNTTFLPTTLKTTVLSGGAPVAGAKVTFDITSDNLNFPHFTSLPIDTGIDGAAGFSYQRWVQSIDKIEADAVKPDGTPFHCEQATAFFAPPYCPVCQTAPQLCKPKAAPNLSGAQPASSPSTPSAYAFRNEVLALTPRGRQYTESYYKYAGEVIRLLIFNPQLFSHAGEALQRYEPVMREMISRAESASGSKDEKAYTEAVNHNKITVTDAEVTDVDDLLRSLADAGASQQLRDTIAGIRRDIHDPQVQAEFGINVVHGDVRAMPGTTALRSSRALGMVSLFGLLTVAGFGALRQRKLPNAKHLSGLLLLILISCAALAGCSSNARKEAAAQNPEPPTVATGSNDRQQPGNPDLTLSPPSSVTTKTQTKSQTAQAYASLPLRFEANRGQAANDATFIARGSGQNVLLSPSGAEIMRKVAEPQSGEMFMQPAASGNRELGRSANFESFLSPINRLRDFKKSNGTYKYFPPTAFTPGQSQSGSDSRSIQMKLIGADPHAQSAGVDKLPGRTNYFIGNDPSKWKSDVPNYAKAQFNGVYPGIDVTYYGNGGQLEYDFNVAPGSDPSKIKLAFHGADHITIGDDGDLVIGDRKGEVLRLQKPVAYQEIAGVQLPIQVEFVTLGPNNEISNRQSAIGNAFGFQVGEYDHSKPLVIDPVILYSTYLGGSGDDEGNTIAVDSAGNAYVIGFTDSLNFPTTNAKQSAFGGAPQDVFVAKLNATGNALVYSTYLGGDGQDHGSAIAVDANGNAYISGYSGSTNFPVANALQSTKKGPFNVFVAKLNPSGSQLLYSTYVGGTSGEFGSAIAIDNSGDALVAGVTTSTDFPTANPIQATFGGNLADAFVCKLNPAGSQLLYSTYLGGTGNDGVTGIALDTSGNAFITGVTFSTNFPIMNATQSTFGGGDFDAFATKISSAGQLIYSTYLGGNDDDRGYRIAVDGSGNAYIAGQTASTNFPRVSALQSTFGGGTDGFVTKLNPSGAISYSTYLGGDRLDGATGIAVDNSGSVYVTGFSDSTNFPAVAALQAVNNGDSDAFVARINAAGSALTYSTYLGGSDRDAAFAIAIDSAGSAYVFGQTNSTDFPSVNFPPNTKGGGAVDAFIAKLSDLSLASSSVQFSAPSFAATEGCAAASINVTRTGPTTNAVNVDYLVNDNTANQRTHYTSSSGTLNFAPGETNKSISILLTENGYAEGTKRANVNLVNIPSGAALGTPRTATLDIADNDATNATTNPVDIAALFVCQHYHDFLNRQGDASGLAFWTNEITSCGSDQSCIEVKRINVSAAYFLSIEFQQTGYLVERMYKTAYGDATGNSTIGGSHLVPVPIVRFDEFLRDTQRIGRGVIVLAPGWEQLLESNKQAFASEFVQRSRFVDAYSLSLTPTQFVDKLNQNAGNVLSSTERTSAINLFSSATNTNNLNARAQAVRQIAEDTDLYNAEFNRAFVLSEYFGYLRRNPNDAPEPTLDYSGFDFWWTKLNQFNGNYINAEMVKAFLSSIEYRQRFSP